MAIAQVTADITEPLIRHGRATDVSYVIRSYVLGVQGALATRRMHGDEFRGRSREQVIGILERPATRLYVACDAVDEDVIIGFSLLERGCVHWVSVRSHWRRQGLALALLKVHQEPLDTYSVWIGGLDAAKLPETWAYDPYAAVWPHWHQTAPRRDQKNRRHKARGQQKDTSNEG